MSAHESKPQQSIGTGINAITAVGKRKHLLSKVNEKKGSGESEDSGGTEATQLSTAGHVLDTTSRRTDTLFVEVAQAKETIGSSKGKVIARKPKERRTQPLRGAAQKKSVQEQQADVLEESTNEHMSNPPARGSSVDWSATMDMRFLPSPFCS